MEADRGPWQAVDKISSRTGLHIYTGVPLAAVVVEAGADGQGDNPIMELWVAAIEPDWGMGAAVVLRDAEGRHRITGHACEAVPLPRHMAVTKGHAG